MSERLIALYVYCEGGDHKFVARKLHDAGLKLLKSGVTSIVFHVTVSEMEEEETNEEG